MKQQKKPAPKGLRIAAFIALVILIILVIVAIFSPKETSEQMSDDEAQTKCMLMEEADLVNLMGEPFGDDTTKKAQQTCLSQWDSPDKVKSFKNTVETEWNERKSEILEGYTLEHYYDEYKK